MALLKINNVRIKGVSAGIPNTVEENSDYPYFDKQNLDRIISSIVVERRHVFDPGQTCGDLACVCADQLMTELGWNRDSIDLLVFCSPSRDYIEPDTSCCIQSRLGLSKSTMAFDMTLGCTGWPYGLMTVASFLQNGSAKRALLLNGSMGKSSTAFTDKTQYPLMGDAATATALEYDVSAKPLWFDAGTDGSGYDCIIIPDGGRRNPVTEDSMKLTQEEDNISRTRLNLHVRGMDVFSFALKTAPESIHRVLEFSGADINQVNNFFMHQSNCYLIKKILKKIQVNPDKAPISMKDYGNTGNCCIPFTMVTQRADLLRNTTSFNCACSYGVGLSWATVIFETDKLTIPNMIVL